MNGSSMERAIEYAMLEHPDFRELMRRKVLNRDPLIGSLDEQTELRCRTCRRVVRPTLGQLYCLAESAVASGRPCAYI
jgi:hypothetical protein